MEVHCESKKGATLTMAITLSILAKFQIYKLSKVVQQHTSGVVDNLIWVCWKFIALCSSVGVVSTSHQRRVGLG